ncbi:MAG: penicillin-binding protein 2 [Patescibacteria group bacterium]
MVTLRERDGGTYGKRLRMLRGVLFAVFGVIWIRLFVLQVVSAQFYQDIANGKYSLYEELVPERGKITVHDFDDSTPYDVATNEPRAVVTADPRKITDATDAGKRIAQALGWEGVDEYDRYALIASLEAQGKQDEADSLRSLTACAPLTKALDEPELGEESVVGGGVDSDVADVTPTPPPEPVAESDECLQEDANVKKITDLIARLGKHDDPYEPVAEGVDAESLDRLLALNIDGISYVLKDSRSYPEKGFGGHVLGFVGKDDSDNPVGNYGLEGYFNDFLSGKPGEISSQLASRAYTPAIDGGSLMLTIDRTVQYTACKMLRDGVQQYHADTGVLVIVEPSTGRILAMCGSPDFDPAEYSKVGSISDFNNQAVFTPYEPGSIFKPFTLAAGIDTGAITPNTIFDDPGFVKLDDRTIRNALQKSYGKITMTQGLEESVNTAMVYAMQRTGKDTFTQYVKNFGFGTLTGITLNTEVSGTVALLDEPGIVYAGTASFGQGITATPLQVVMGYAAIANGGALMVPQIVDQMEYSDGTIDKKLPVKIRQVIDAKTAATVGGMLVSVVENGHGKRASVPGYWIAGKTGTAQIAENGGYSETAFNGSFAGFGPVEDPKFAMIVKLSNPKTVSNLGVAWGEATAAPVFGEIAKFLMQYYRIPPTR